MTTTAALASALGRALSGRGIGVGIAAAILLVAGCGKDTTSGQQPAAAPPPQVAVVEVVPQTVTLERIYPGRAQAADDVEVRARVQGILLKRHYTEGSRVKAGTLLFEIDPAPFEAKVAQAEAELARAQAQLRQAEREWVRTSALFQDNAVSARQRDEALSAYELAQANVATAEAVLRDARIQLGYTKVTAPIDGFTGLREVSEGNLVQPGTLLTTIRQLDPLHVLFSMPEADAVAQRRHGAGAAQLPATLLLPTGAAYDKPGKIDFTATAIDPRTSTVQARAVFANPKGLLLPGQFVRVAVGGLEVPDSIVVPPKAIAQGPQGPAVYVVDEQNVAQLRPVKLGPLVPQGQVIDEGLVGGERVIVEGLVRVRAGNPVKPVPLAAQADAGAGQ